MVRPLLLLTNHEVNWRENLTHHFEMVICVAKELKFVVKPYCDALLFSYCTVLSCYFRRSRNVICLRKWNGFCGFPRNWCIPDIPERKMPKNSHILHRNRNRFMAGIRNSAGIISTLSRTLLRNSGKQCTSGAVIPCLECFQLLHTLHTTPVRTRWSLGPIYLPSRDSPRSICSSFVVFAFTFVVLTWT